MNKTKTITKQASFLPTAYSFDPAKALTPHKLHFDPFSTFVQNNEPLLHFLYYVALVMIGVGFMKLSLNIIAGASLIALILSDISYFYQNQIGKECEFPLHKHSNLIVRQNYFDMALDYQTKDYSYFLYVKDPTKKIFKLIYLGQIENGKVTLDDTSAASRSFVHYYDYIQEHHLNNRFKDKTYFERDPKTVNRHSTPQYILKGSGIVLKMNSDKQEIELTQDY